MGAGAGPARAECPAVEVMEKASQGDWGLPELAAMTEELAKDKWKEWVGK